MAKKINADDLRMALMAAIDRINTDDDIENAPDRENVLLEIEKAKAISLLADNIIDLAKCENMHNAILLKQRQLQSSGKLDNQDKPIVTNIGFFALDK